jgi:hypothetical protein
VSDDDEGGLGRRLMSFTGILPLAFEDGPARGNGLVGRSSSP